MSKAQPASTSLLDALSFFYLTVMKIAEGILVASAFKYASTKNSTTALVIFCQMIIISLAMSISIDIFNFMIDRNQKALNEMSAEKRNVIGLFAMFVFIPVAYLMVYIVNELVSFALVTFG